MESTTKTTRFGQFTLAGGLGYTTLVAASLSAVRVGIVAEWYWVTWLGIFALGAELGMGMAVIVWPRHKLISALAGTILLPLGLVVYVGIEVYRTHHEHTTVRPLPPANPQPSSDPSPAGSTAGPRVE